MAWHSQSLLLVSLVICLRFVIGEHVELECEEFKSCTVGSGCYWSTEDLDRTCSIRELLVNHTQHVIITRHWPNLCTETNIMKFYESSLPYIPQPIFSAFENLEELDMSSSGIVELTRNTFASAKNLQLLNLSKNNISETSDAVFQGANNLLRIDMSHNRISQLGEYTFNGLELLRAVNLSNNKIRIIEKGIFSENMLIETVNLEENQIDHLDVGVFSNSIHLEEVNLAGNELSILDPNMFNSDTLISIDVSRNRFTNLNTFTSIANLRKLSVAHNKIGKINITTLAKLSNLEILNLKNTSISGLTFGTFSQQRNVSVLDLSDNSLQHLNLDIFLPYMSLGLEELYLNGNNLSEVEGRNTLASFSSLKKLGLSRNKFNCSYLIHLISLGRFPTKIEFNSDGRQMPDDGKHIHGIECTHDEKATKNDNGFMAKSTKTNDTFDQNLPLLLEKHFKLQNQEINLQEKHLTLMELQEHHLIIIEFFVILVVLNCIVFFVWKGISAYVNWKRQSTEKKIYRSTNIQSEVSI